MNIENTNKEYHKNYHMVFSCQYHIIFCPKFRRPVLVDGIDKRLKELVIQNENKKNYKVIEMEVMPEHVHLLIDIDPKIGVYKTICFLKGLTSRKLREEFPVLRSRLPTLWTRSEFVSTVGCVSLEKVKQYIIDQKGI